MVLDEIFRENQSDKPRGLGQDPKCREGGAEQKLDYGEIARKVSAILEKKAE